MCCKQPYENDEDESKEVTVGMLKEMLEDVPDDYKVRFDGTCGHVVKRDFTIYDDYKIVSISD